MDSATAAGGGANFLELANTVSNSWVYCIWEKVKRVAIMKMQYEWNSISIKLLFAHIQICLWSASNYNSIFQEEKNCPK